MNDEHAQSIQAEQSRIKELAIDIVQDVMMEMGSPHREMLNALAREIIQRIEAIR